MGAPEIQSADTTDIPKLIDGKIFYSIDGWKIDFEKKIARVYTNYWGLNSPTIIKSSQVITYDNLDDFLVERLTITKKGYMFFPRNNPRWFYKQHLSNNGEIVFIAYKVEPQK